MKHVSCQILLLYIAGKYIALHQCNSEKKIIKLPNVHLEKSLPTEELFVLQCGITERWRVTFWA